MHVLLSTDRLVLRRFTEADATFLFALDSDPAVMRYIGPHALPSVAAYRQRIRTRFLPYYEQFAHYGFWIAEAKATGTALGWFHLRPALDYAYAAEAGYQANEVDLGYRLRYSAWGKGYGTEGARALVYNTFAHTNAASIVATALAGNVVSIRVLEKAGLRRVVEFTLPGYDMAAVKYALTREAYQG